MAVVTAIAGAAIAVGGAVRVQFPQAKKLKELVEEPLAQEPVWITLKIIDKM